MHNCLQFCMCVISLFWEGNLTFASSNNYSFLKGGFCMKTYSRVFTWSVLWGCFNQTLSIHSMSNFAQPVFHIHFSQIYWNLNCVKKKSLETWIDQVLLDVPLFSNLFYQLSGKQKNLWMHLMNLSNFIVKSFWLEKVKRIV